MGRVRSARNGSQMSQSASGGGVVDGRTARGARTRGRLIDATMALVDEGDVRPTAPRIAERAGVSVRTVFQHFDDLEALYGELGDRAFARARRLANPIDVTAPLSERVEAFVVERCRINEMMGPINRAAMVAAPTSPTIRAQFDRGHDLATIGLQRVFATEFEALGERSPDLFDGLRLATSWSTWNLCRQVEGRSVEESTAIVRRVVGVVLTGCGLDPELDART